MKKDGQAFLELALVAPLFILFFWIACQFAFLFQCRLKLISLKREFALGRGRLAEGSASDGKLLNALAEKVGLDPKRLSLRQETMTSARSGLSGPIQILPASWLDADRLTFTYAYRFSGAAALLFPAGLRLEESLVCKSGTWKAAPF